MAKRKDKSQPFVVRIEGPVETGYLKKGHVVNDPNDATRASWPSGAQAVLKAYKLQHPRSRLKVHDTRLDAVQDARTKAEAHQSHIDKMVGNGAVSIQPIKHPEPTQDVPHMTLRLVLPADPATILDAVSKFWQEAQAFGQIEELTVTNFPTHINFLQGV